MSLAYLTSVFPELTGTFIYREVFELQRRGVHLKIYSIHKPNPRELSQEAIPLCEHTYYLLPANVFNVLRSHIKFFVKFPMKYISTLSRMMTGTYYRFGDRVRGLKHFAEGVVLADRMIRDGIMHTHAHYASYPSSIAHTIHLLVGIPYSFSAHAYDIWYDKLLLPEKLHKCTFAICCSEFGRKALINQSRSNVSHKIHLLYHGIDVRKFHFPKFDIHPSRKILLSVGRLTEQKGFPHLIEACVILRDRGIDIECQIIGEGEQRSELEALIKYYKIDGQIKLLGSIKQERILIYYQSAWAFVLPSVDTHDGDRDGIPNVLMEAMAAGCPVITTTNSGQAELIDNGNSGLLVSQKSAVEIADAVERLWKDHLLWERIRYQARIKVENDFDSQKTIESLLGIFNEFVFTNGTDRI
jgi:colanic acid/amylovoran biosynthesis glycosyltransferase